MSLKFCCEHRLADYIAMMEAAEQYELTATQRWFNALASAAMIAAGLLAGGSIAMALATNASVTTSYCLAGAVFGYLVSGLASRPAAMRAARLRPSIRAAEGMRAEVELHGDMLVLLGGGVTETIPWASIRFVVETSAGLFIACGSGAAILPAVAFQSGSDRGAARDWIRTHLSPEARTRSRLMQAKESPSSRAAG